MARALVPTRPTPAQVRRRVCGLVLMLIPSFTVFAIVRSGAGNG